MLYLDNAATTKCLNSNIEIINHYLLNDFFNPSASYADAVRIKADINSTRENILNLLRGKGKIIFTSSGTESNNQALLCSSKPKGSRIIISNAEHASIYNTAMVLKQQGYDVVLCPVKSDGTVLLDEFVNLLKENTSLISIMHVNNETGGINDIQQLVRLTRTHAPNAIFHSDGVQAVGKTLVSLLDLGVDLYSFSGHKIGAPKGVAGLYVKQNINISPLLNGGGQELGLRSSTENVAFIKAFENTILTRLNALNANIKTIQTLWNKMYEDFKTIKGVQILSSQNGTPFIFCLSSNIVRGEVMQHALERKGIFIGIGSACSSNKASERIPKALNLTKEYSKGIMRISLNIDSNIDDITLCITEIKNAFKELGIYGK